MLSASTSASEHAGEAAGAIWRRLALTAQPAEAIDALLGIGFVRAAHIIDETTLISSEIRRLLDAAPSLLNNPDRGHESRLTSTTGGIRGPVLWSETLSARSASGGAGGVYVYTESHRSTDTPLNRVLVWSLEQIGLLAQRLCDTDGASADSTLATHALETHALVRDALAHRVLAAVRDRQRAARTHITRRDVSLARRSRAATRYESAFRAFERLHDPVDAIACGEMSTSASPATRARLVLFSSTLAAIEQRHPDLAPLAIRNSALTTGPVRYWPDRGDERGAIALGDVVIDTPEHLAALTLRPEIGERAARGVVVTVADPVSLNHALDIAEQRLQR